MMHYEPPESTEFDEIHELNLLFLTYLRSCAREGQDCLDLPRDAIPALRELSSDALQTIAEFPRSLYTLQLGRATEMHERPSLPHARLAEARQALTLTILHSAWNMSRHRDFQARMFLRLTATETHQLRSTPLSEIPILAATPGLLSSRFPGARALWGTLVSRTEDEMTRAFRLTALQPDLDPTLLKPTFGRSASAAS
jgi:hypothetical protein